MSTILLNPDTSTPSSIRSRVAQWKRAGPITQRSVDRNHALLCIFVQYYFCPYVNNLVKSRYFHSFFNKKQSGAVEACWAHNPEVRGSKPRSAIVFLYSTIFVLMSTILLNPDTSTASSIRSRVAQWKRAGPITQRSVDRNHALLCIFCTVLFLSLCQQSC